jgi:hypothetical protein
MAEIFLSYRRQDSESATGRLADALEAHFGDDRVFRDREIGAGENFVEAIRRSVGSSTVVLAVIGRRWLIAADVEGRRRLDDPADFVRLEIELALAARVAVVPVLIEGATMPAAADLPPSLAEFSRCQAIDLSDTRWRYDVDRLIEMLRTRFAIESEPVPLSAESGNPVGAATRIAADLIDLALHPRRLIARRQTGRASDHAHAFGFLAAAILVGNLALLVGLNVPMGAHTSLGVTLSASASWLLAGELVGLLLAGLLTGTLALAWRVADPSAGYRRVGLVAAYVYSGAWLGLCAGALVLGAAVQLIDPGFLARLVAALNAAMSAPPSSPGWLPELRAVDGAPFRGPAAVLLLLAFAIWLVTAVWCLVAWGAFRNAFGASRSRAWAATSIWVALVGALLWLGARLG